MSQPSTPPAETNGPAPLTKGALALTSVTLLFAAAFWLMIFGQLQLLAPLTIKMMQEYKTRVPWLSERVMYDFSWFVPVIAIVTLAVCVAVRKRWAWSFALLVLPLLINLFVTLSLFIPTLELLNGLSGRLAGN